MKTLGLIVLLAVSALPLAGCVVEGSVGPAYGGAPWVPGHYGPNGYWIRGHYA